MCPVIAETGWVNIYPLLLDGAYANKANHGCGRVGQAMDVADQLGRLDVEERTYTDNISARGARVYSVRLWQIGDAVNVTPQNEAPTCGNVVYCQRLADDRYAVGVKFLDPTIAWSAVRRFAGFTDQPGAR